MRVHEAFDYAVEVKVEGGGLVVVPGEYDWRGLLLIMNPEDVVLLGPLRGWSPWSTLAFVHLGGGAADRLFMVRLAAMG